MIIASLAVSITVSGCGGGNNGEPENGGEVKLLINHLPFSGEYSVATAGVYLQKPVQAAGWGKENVQAECYMTPDNTTGTLYHVADEYSGGEGYIYVNLMPGVLKNGYYYQNFISKNKVELKQGNNTFNFNTDFEILHQFAGNQGILRIEDVPAEYTESIAYLRVIENLGETGADGLPVDADAASLKPIALHGDPHHYDPYGDYGGDFLSIPLTAVENQHHGHGVADVWTYDITNRRFDQSGAFLVYMNGFDPEGYHTYVAQANFTNGKATIQWANVKKVD